MRRTGTVAALTVTLLLVGCSSDAGGEAKPAAATEEPAKAKAKAEPSRTVTTTATGTATGVPDQLTADVGISTGGPSAAAVLADNNERTQRLLDELKIGGIDDKDVATTAVNLSPTYDKNGNIKGYVANNMLRVTLRDLKTAGVRLDKLVQAGGDRARINGISLGFQDDDELLTKARVDAVKRARAQATEMAEAAGAEVGEVRTITDEIQGGVYPMSEQSLTAFRATDSSVPIAAGSEDLAVQVKVVWELAA
ncbi:MAG: hypothetical protein JWM47_690 [Acidimicrobiales bacterium]|nr:hypothetical protein [Acidimicrobiales bacterium]